MVVKIRPGSVAKSLQRRDAAYRKELGVAMMRAANRGRVILRRRTPTDQGQLKNSWRVRKGNTFGARGGSTLAVLENDAPHAGIVERGARPHKVGRAGWNAIYQWVERNRKKFAISGPQQLLQGPRRKGQRGGLQLKLEPNLVAITWGIVKRIETQGQRPTYFVLDSLSDLYRIVGLEVTKATKRVSKKPYGGRR